jgi:hypothetical protein
LIWSGKASVVKSKSSAVTGLSNIKSRTVPPTTNSLNPASRNLEAIGAISLKTGAKRWGTTL